MTTSRANSLSRIEPVQRKVLVGRQVVTTSALDICTERERERQREKQRDRALLHAQDDEKALAKLGRTLLQRYGSHFVLRTGKYRMKTFQTVIKDGPDCSCRPTAFTASRYSEGTQSSYHRGRCDCAVEALIRKTRACLPTTTPVHLGLFFHAL